MRVHIDVNDELANAAIEGGGLPAETSVPKVIKYALAVLAGYPESAAKVVSKIATTR